MAALTSAPVRSLDAQTTGRIAMPKLMARLTAISGTCAATLSRLLHPALVLLVLKATGSGFHHPTKPAQSANLPVPPEESQSSEQVFLTRIAHLSATERTAAIQQRQWYIKLAERQGVVDAEWRSNQYLRTRDERYR